VPAARSLSIACYLSSHGWGHVVRSVEVLRRLRRARPDWRLTIVAEAPASLLRPLDGPGVEVQRRAIDFGLVQRTPLHIDHEATGAKLARLLADRECVVASEARFLSGFDGVYADAPFLAFEAAARAGLPSAGLGNFTWDWVYAYYHRAGGGAVFGEAAETACAAHALCGMYLQLPGGPVADSFPRVYPIPLACRTEARPRDEVRMALGIPEGTRVWLVGLASLQLSPAARAKLESLPDTVLLAPAPLTLGFANALEPEPDRFSFPDLMRAADAVVTKPGYGIVSDAVAARVPVVYTDRGDFPEVPYLVRLVDETVGGRFLPREAFEQGLWDEAASGLVARSCDVRVDGAEVAAQSLVRYFETGETGPAAPR